MPTRTVMPTRSRGVGASVLLLMLLWLPAGCTGTPRVAPTGLLGDYSEFLPAADDPERLVYRRPGRSLAEFDAVMIEPVQIALAPESAGNAVDPQELARLAKYLHDALVLAMRGAYPVVDAGGPRVLRVRVALTDVIATRPVLSTTGTLALPVRVVSAGKRVISGTDLFVGEVEVEAELVDSQSGERVLGVVDRKAGDNFSLRRGTTPWGHVEKAFREWAVAFRRIMDEEHGRR